MNVVVIGAGEVGFHLAKYLNKESHRVTLVDADPRALARAARLLDVQTVEGHGADDRVLRQAGVERADLVVAVTNVDELNMLASVVAKKLGAERTVVRVHADRHLLDHQYFYKDTLGFDLTISPDEMMAMETVRICRGQNALPAESFAGGRLQMNRVEILEGSPSVGKSIAELRLPKQALITAIVRDKEVSIPRGTFRLQVGDLVVLSGAPEPLIKSERILGGRRDLPNRVLLVGGGRIALIVAKRLKPLGIRVALIEPERDAAEALSRAWPEGDVIHGRGTDVELLTQEGIERTDVFVSMDRQDEVNLLACQLAKSLGAARTVALVTRRDYVALVDRLGIDHALRPNRLVARRIARFVRGEGRSRVAILHHGQAEVLDQMIEAGSVGVGARVSEIGFPEGTIVGGVVRGEEVIVPDGKTQLEAGDHLIMIALADRVPDLEALLRSRA